MCAAANCASAASVSVLLPVLCCRCCRCCLLHSAMPLCVAFVSCAPLYLSPFMSLLLVHIVCTNNRPPLCKQTGGRGGGSGGGAGGRVSKFTSTPHPQPPQGRHHPYAGAGGAGGGDNRGPPPNRAAREPPWRQNPINSNNQNPRGVGPGGPVVMLPQQLPPGDYIGVFFF